jgi:adenylylsulfate kinase
MNNKSTNVFWEKSLITRQDREALNGHKSFVLWFTGLSGSGKSTLAHAVEKKLYERGCRTFVLDGDNVRHGLSSNLSFSEEDRKENIRRIGEAAKLMTEAGVIALTAFISPFRADRGMVRSLFPHGEFIEVYCDASLEVCESRDVKGLYKKSKGGRDKELHRY